MKKLHEEEIKKRLKIHYGEIIEIKIPLPIAQYVALKYIEENENVPIIPFILQATDIGIDSFKVPVDFRPNKKEMGCFIDFLRENHYYESPEC